MYLLYFYVPINEKEKVKEAVFKAGAGSLGDYTKCSFEYEGVGQFLPGKKSNPTIGKKEILEKVSEVKVEVICSTEKLKESILKLKESHPYEEPAYGAIKIEV